MCALEPRDGVVVAAEHEGGRREELEVRRVERLLRVRARESTRAPGARLACVGLPAPLELVGPVPHAAAHALANVIAGCDGAGTGGRRLSRPPSPPAPRSSSAASDVPDLLVDDRLQDALAHRADRAGDLHVRLPRHRGRLPLAGERERRRHVHQRADALPLRVERGELERPLLELRERDRHLQPAEPERHLDLRAPVRVVRDLEALHAGHRLRHLRRVVDHAPDDLARRVELLRPLELHFDVTSTFSRDRSGSRSISQTRW